MSSTASDLYKILGVSRDASTEEIRKAYYRLAKKFHPDKNGSTPEANEKFKVIANAYAVLADPDNRGKYDRGEEIKPDNSLAKLMQSMSQLLIKAIQGNDVKMTDLLTIMKNELNAAIAQGEKMKQQIVDAVIKLNEARDRFGGETETVEAILLNTISGMERQKKEVDEEMEMVKAIMVKVKHMTYRVDKKDKESGYTKLNIDEVFRTMYGGK